ncbi:MAG: DAK2 domain-containing protein [Candidatus Nomurabacteria bacterium]|nr:DAK2 domain-containing protein [Candidatus Nomurabacteria bacterium]
MKNFDLKLAVAGLDSAVRLLAEHEAQINELNVFPIADGDTGRNMLATCQGMLAEAENLPKSVSLKTFCDRLSQRALSSSRGNAGTILAKMVLGFAERVRQADEMDLTVLDEALQLARSRAEQAVDKPKLGTILTVLGGMADYINLQRRRAITSTANVSDSQRMWSALNELPVEAYRALDETPELMSLLKENGVVDAGGLGLALMVEGFLSGLKGEELDSSIYSERLKQYQPKVKMEQVYHQDDEHAYCTELTFYPNKPIKADKITKYLHKMGNSVIFAGNELSGMYKVHIHTDQPEKVFAYFRQRGKVEIAQANDMRNQVIRRLEDLIDKNPRRFGSVVVSDGREMAALLKEAGVDIVVDGKQTPAAVMKDVSEAVSLVGKYVDFVFVFMKARRGCALSPILSATNKPVWVVGIKNAPQAIFAIESLDATESFDENVLLAQRTIRNLRTGEIAFATKNTKLAKGGLARNGDFFSTINVGNSLSSIVGESWETVFGMTLDVVLKDASYLAVYYDGKQCDEVRALKLQERVMANHPLLEVEIFHGGQTSSSIIMVAEE